VDSNDSWRHSKWLSMIRKRLLLAKRLLKPDTGVLIVTIDEHEVHHLGILIEQLFPQNVRQMVTIVINQKGVAQGRLSRVEEYALYVFMSEAYLSPGPDDLLSPEQHGNRFATPRWEWLLRGGTNSRRQDRQWLFYPIYIDPEQKSIIDIGEPMPLDEMPDINRIDQTIAWPIRTDHSLGRWRVSPPTLRKLLAQGYVKLGGYDTKRKTWTVLYLGEKARRQIEEGIIKIVDRDEKSGVVKVEYIESRQRNTKTVWHRPTHDSGNYGSSLLRNILRDEGDFSFPKSLYAVKDAITPVVSNRENALILDFFAGSGTTLHATLLLNAADGGSRQCILVTDNEVSENEAKQLSAQGYQPNDREWEAHGICRSVTFPRCKYVIQGKRDDGTELEGEYLTGRTLTKEKPRTFRKIGFIHGVRAQGSLMLQCETI
jgi:adenine-specific DNA-methyltransferase